VQVVAIDVWGQTALHVASERCHLKVVRTGEPLSACTLGFEHLKFPPKPKIKPAHCYEYSASSSAFTLAAPCTRTGIVSTCSRKWYWRFRGCLRCSCSKARWRLAAQGLVAAAAAAFAVLFQDTMLLASQYRSLLLFLRSTRFYRAAGKAI
jgi:hypothetical protein